MYKLLKTNDVLRLLENAIIPQDPANIDWQLYQQWLEQGNTPEPADPEPTLDAAAQIEALEREYMLPRPVRDVLLPLMEAKAVELGYTIEQLRTSNSGYRKVKELDEQIAILRNQL